MAAEKDKKKAPSDAHPEAEGAKRTEGPPKEPPKGENPDGGGEEEPPKPSELPPFVKTIIETFKDSVLESRMRVDEPTLIVKPQDLIPLCSFIRDDEGIRMDYLSCITTVDYPERSPRFDVIYNLYSIPKGHRLNLVIRIADGEEAPSLIPIWPTADWQEREAWDMMGVRFSGHPNLKRILLPDWWEGHPLRKDYPLEGRGEEQKVMEECQKPKS